MRAGELLTLQATACELDVSVSTLKRRIRAGALPVFRDGRIVRVRRPDLERYQLERIVRATPPAGSRAAEHAPQSAGRLWE